MSIANKLVIIAENTPKVYKVGQLATLKESEYMNANLTDTIISVNDVSPITHNVGVKLTSETITDFSNVTLTRCGKNLFPFAKSVTISGNYVNWAYNDFLPPQRNISFLRGKKITYSAYFDLSNVVEDTANVSIKTIFYDASGTIISQSFSDKLEKSKGQTQGRVYLVSEVPENTERIDFCLCVFFNSEEKPDPASYVIVSQGMVELDDTPTEYEAYNGQTYTANAGSTVDPWELSGLHQNKVLDFEALVPGEGAFTDVSTNDVAVSSSTTYDVAVEENGNKYLVVPEGDTIYFDAHSNIETLSFDIKMEGIASPFIIYHYDHYTGDDGTTYNPRGSLDINYNANENKYKLRSSGSRGALIDLDKNVSGSDFDWSEQWATIELTYGTKFSTSSASDRMDHLCGINGPASAYNYNNRYLTKIRFIDKANDTTLIDLDVNDTTLIDHDVKSEYHKYLCAYGVNKNIKADGIGADTIQFGLRAHANYAAFVDNIRVIYNNTQKVIDLIDDIGVVTYTAESLAKIEKAEVGYSLLTDEQKADVTNYETLVAARAEYDYLEENAELNLVIAKISADGTIDGVTSLSPSMTLVTDTDGVAVNCNYYRDIDTYIEKINEISGGGEGQYEQGFIDGQQAEYDRFWDSAQGNGNRRDYNGAFSGVLWNSETFKPKYDLIITNAYGAFQNSLNLSINLKEVLENQGIILDISGAKDCTSVFQNASSITEFPIISFKSATSIDFAFHNCLKLHTIEKVIMPDNETAQMASPFANTVALKNIIIEGTIPKSLSFASSPLTVASMKSIINALKNYAGTSSEGTYKITFSSTCWANLEADSTSPTGTTWKDYVKNLGWLT